MIATLFVAAMALQANPPEGKPLRNVSFTKKAHDFSWPLAELGAELPSDWSDFDFLTLELRSSTAQRFEFRIETADGPRQLGMLPLPNAWIRAALPLRYFERADREGHDLASVGNKPRAGYWVNLSGPQGPLNAVQGLGIMMKGPIGSPTLAIRSVQLDRESPGDAVLDPDPLVDEFGQWIHADWPGKARTLDALKAAWAEESGQLKSSATHACRYGGFAGTHAKATGFFRVEQLDGRWWFVDPDGHLFFSVGANVMTPWVGTPVVGRENMFAALPPSDPIPGKRHGRDGEVSFYTWNLQRRFGREWREGWLETTFRRMDAWGFNTVACWSDQRLWDAARKPYIVILGGWGGEGDIMGLPDVFADSFAQRAEAAARAQCAPRKNDPFLLGYFVGNEPPWPDRELDIADAMLNGPPGAMQHALKQFLAEGDTQARRREFVQQAIETYFTVINAAIRRSDPNHLNLGIRFGWRPSDAILRASRGFDVFSMNGYNDEVNRESVETAHRITGLPVLIGEFHFGTPGRGLAPGLRQTANHAERGVAYRRYVEDAAANPAIIGAHWFQWVDEPNTGRFDGENYNIGFVDVTDRPYAELVNAATITHKRLPGIHAGSEPPINVKARTDE